MPTVLTRNVTRVVSTSLVTSLTEQGLVLRRPYGRRKVLLTWEHLEREYLNDAQTGIEAFDRPLPSRWLPSIGDTVWVKPGGTAWRGEVAKVLLGMGEEVVEVFVSHGGKKKREVRVLLSQTRPIRED